MSPSEFIRRVRDWWNDPTREKAKPTDVAIAILTIGIVISAFLQLGVFILQLVEMRGAGKQTDRIIAADERLAAAMERSVGQSQEAIKRNIEIFEKDQRAWIGVKSMEGNVGPEKGNVKIKFTNTGKTPALALHFAWETNCGPKGIVPKFTYTESGAEGRFVLVPGQEMQGESISRPGGPICSIEHLQQLTTGTGALWASGTIWYQDVFGKAHATEFCGLFTGGEQAFTPCKFHNSAN